MPEVGEEIVGTWLRYCAGCDFVDYNVSTRRSGAGLRKGRQGEIDVIGINLAERSALICEVATHTSGLGYKNNEEVIFKKFERAVAYAADYLTSFPNHKFMFWAPVVLGGAQTRAVKNVQLQLQELGVDLQLIINEIYAGKLSELREKASTDRASSPHSVYRLLQIEERVRGRDRPS